jgi:hypothetical protein
LVALLHGSHQHASLYLRFDLRSLHAA